MVALFTLEFWKSVSYLVSSQNFRAGSVSKATEQTYRCGPPTFCLIGSPVALNLMVRFVRLKIQKRLQRTCLATDDLVQAWAEAIVALL